MTAITGMFTSPDDLLGNIFTIRSPNAAQKRRRFSILRLEVIPGKPKKTKVVPSPELDEVNSRYLEGVYSFGAARALVEDLRKKLDLKENGHRYKPLTSAENLRLLESYWEKDYAYRDILPDSAYVMRKELERALELLGDLPLQTAEQSELAKKIKDAELQVNSKRRLISRLNQLLRFAGRRFTLKLPKKQFKKIRYLSIEYVEQLAAVLEGHYRDLALIAFATGCRAGEIFAIDEFSMRGTILQVPRQMPRDGEERLPKNRKQRNVPVEDMGLPAIERWAKVPHSERMEIRNANLAKIVRDGCKKLWPKEPDKHIVFHDLRHSFAIHMLRLGESLSTTSQLLGNSIHVCQTYYTGFAMADESLAALDARLRQKEKS